ncbi:hypothetical protein SLH49_20885 [Cognatiyoonia sp. IB215446]|uniref:YncE family protein n=1 Tax=Cognatiyoonia sp. IB215446 TaxID=3097355 RepID=UPI002A122802|nr:hypothetical protein [Cognatiyoonia sp. IB215446]MDX8350452.1 hypothetical protein [Cognatiyoonia sp. IB215446]
MKYPFQITVSAFAAVVLATHSFAQDTPPDFQGRYIAAISDGDMRAFAYIDGDLGVPRGPDALNMIPLPLNTNPTVAAIEVPNTVINPVYSIAHSPDGSTIFVVETHTQREEGDRTIMDLQPGTMLRAVDVSDPTAPRVIDSIDVGVAPQGVSVSPDGSTLVIATKAAPEPLVFVSWQDGQFGDVQRFDLGEIAPMPELPDQGLLPHHAEWHPTADVIAVTLQLRGQVRFFQVARSEDGRVTDLSVWGNPVTTSKWPMSGKFSRDGRFFVTNDLQWGPDVRGFYLNAPPSQLTSIELAPLDAEAPRHFVVGGVSLPRHAESIAFSNAGDLIATVNIGQTWPGGDAVEATLSTVSLVEFDPEFGQQTVLGSWEFEGDLPEGVAFDASDSFIAFGVFEYAGPEPRASDLQIWEVVTSEDGTRGLSDTGYRIPTGPGAHSLVVVN